MTDDPITGYAVHVLRIPAKTVHSHGSGDVAAINAAILELTTKSGRTGWGEASPWPVFTGTVEASAAALHTYFRPLVVGQTATDYGRIIDQAASTVVGSNEAKAALETALLDLLGQQAGLPIAALVGGVRRTRIPMSFSVANPDFDADLQDIAALVADGVRIFKLKTGFADDEFDRFRLARLREIYGAKIRLRIDYNQGLAPHDALRSAKPLEQFNLDFIEQPVPMRDRETMAALARALDTPLMADESVFDVRDALDGVARNVADIYSLKIMKSGGIIPALQVAAIAQAAGKAVYGGCMFETGIAHTAGTHLMAAVPDLTLGCEFYMSTYYAQEDILSQPFDVREGHVHLPEGPGLGVGVDRERLAEYTVASYD